MDVVEDVAPHRDRDERCDAAGERRGERAPPAQEREPDEHGQDEAGRQLDAEAERDGRAAERRLDVAAAEQQAGGDDRERRRDEVVLRRRRLERDEREGRDQEGARRRGARREAEPARGAVDGDERRELGQVLRQRVERLAAGRDDGKRICCSASGWNSFIRTVGAFGIQ